MSAIPNLAPRQDGDTAETIGRLLVAQGLISDKQLKHAQRVRSKLARAKTLLNTMLELEYFTTPQFNAALRAGAVEIRLGDLLVELGDISVMELETAVRIQKEKSSHGKKLGEILIEQRFIKEHRLIDVLATNLGFLHIEPEFSAIDKELLRGLTGQQCEQYGFIPVQRDNDSIIVACTDPKSRDIARAAEGLLRGKVLLAICTRHALNVAINKFKSAAGGKVVVAAADDSKVACLVDEILHAAVSLGASDIHCEPMTDKLRIRFRRDGVLWHYKDQPLDLVPNFIARLKIMSKANIAEKRRHQD